MKSASEAIQAEAARFDELQSARSGAEATRMPRVNYIPVVHTVSNMHSLSLQSCKPEIS